MKIKRTAKFHKKLTLKQVAHCKEFGINPRNIEDHIELMFRNVEDGTLGHLCNECLGINKRLQEVA